MSLIDVKVGKIYKVISVDVDGRTKKRLQDMGITVGARLDIMFRLGDHAIVMRVRGSRVALSSEILSGIEVVEEMEVITDKEGN